MSPTDQRTVFHIFLVVNATDQLIQPGEQRILQSRDLLLAASDHTLGRRMFLNDRVEIVDQLREMGCHQSSNGPHPLHVRVGPADILLELPVAFKETSRFHRRHRLIGEMKRPRTSLYFRIAREH